MSSQPHYLRPQPEPPLRTMSESMAMQQQESVLICVDYIMIREHGNIPFMGSMLQREARTSLRQHTSWRVGVGEVTSLLCAVWCYGSRGDSPFSSMFVVRKTSMNERELFLPLISLSV